MPLNPSAYNTLLLSVQDLINNSQVQPNVNAQVLIPSIKYAQDMYLQPILGTEFLNYLQTGVSTNTLTTDDTNLLNIYIKPILIQYSMMDNIFNNSFKQTVKGLEQMTSDSSTPASQSTIEAMSERFRSAGAQYAERLKDYLAVKYQLFPSYRESMVDQGDMLPNRRTSYLGNFGLAPTRRNNRRGGLYGGSVIIFG